MAGLGNSRSIVDLANEEISIYKVLDMVGVNAYGFYGNTSKIYCPFGALNHFDGGQERAMRVYEETNSLYCFACSKYFSPVILWSEYSDMTHEESAEYLLEGIGWKPETYEDKWRKLTDEEKFDSSTLYQALDTYCSSIRSDWEIVRIDTPYIEIYSQVMELVPYIRSREEASSWLKVAKKKMREVLDDSRSRARTCGDSS